MESPMAVELGFHMIDEIEENNWSVSVIGRVTNANLV